MNGHYGLDDEGLVKINVINDVMAAKSFASSSHDSIHRWNILSSLDWSVISFTIHPNSMSLSNW